MTWLRAVGCGGFFLSVLLAWPVFGEEEGPFTHLYDTGAASAEPLSEAALAKRPAWQLIPEDTTDHKFAGDAVVSNDKLALVLRQAGQAAEVYSRAAKGSPRRATVGLAGGHLARGTLKVIENSASAVLIEAGFEGERKGSLRFRLTTGEAILEMRSQGGGAFVTVQCQARFTVVPDYFGDDVVLGGRAVADQCLPAENFFLNLLEGGDCILMTVWQSGGEEAWVSTENPGGPGATTASRVRCPQGKSVWLALLESPGVWQACEKLDAVAWRAPFPAKWRASLVRGNGLAHSWEADKPHAAAAAAGEQAGPILVYPMDRSTATPLTVTCPTDVMRNTLGVGPCQYILACEGMSAAGDPTPNSVMHWVEQQFEQKKEKKAADDIKERLEQMNAHVAEAQGRIRRYQGFSAQFRKGLPSGPEAGAFGVILDEFDGFVAGGLAAGGSPARATELSAKVMGLIGQANAAVACRRLGEELRAVGAAQDSALARCRMAVRRLAALNRTLAGGTAPRTSLSPELVKLVDQMLQTKPASTPK
jgi:hypothetical protein